MAMADVFGPPAARLGLLSNIHVLKIGEQLSGAAVGGRHSVDQPSSPARNFVKLTPPHPVQLQCYSPRAWI
jgi:hypothetical protein